MRFNLLAASLLMVSCAGPGKILPIRSGSEFALASTQLFRLERSSHKDPDASKRLWEYYAFYRANPEEAEEVQREAAKDGHAWALDLAKR